jgi:hypothetical protein
LAGVAAYAPAALADFELLLEDGRLLSGVDVRREGGEYLLEQEGGQVGPVPEELVAEVRITAGYARGVRRTEPETLAGQEIDLDSEDEDRPPSGVRRTGPTVLAGDKIRPPRTSEQVAALGEPSKFAGNIIDPYWRPESVFNASNDVTEFNPARWADDIVDPTWKPSSDYTQGTDVTEFSPSSFSDNIVDPSWKPEDGFKR